MIPGAPNWFNLQVKLLGVKCVACSEKADFIASLQVESLPWLDTLVGSK